MTNSHRSVLYFLLALALVRGVIYASVIPPWQAPDEPPHFERARAALSGSEWNATFDREPSWYDELVQSLFRFHFWSHVNTARPVYDADAPLSNYIAPYHEIYQGLYSSRPAYLLLGWPLFLAPRQEVIFQLYLVRLNMVLMNVGVIFLAYLTGRLLFPKDDFMALGAPTLILFLPQHTHLMAAVNNGNLAELLVTAALYFMARTLVRGFSLLNVSAVILLTLLAMWTKATSYFMVVPIGGLALFFLWRYRRRWPWLLPAGLLLAGLVYVLIPSRLKILLGDAWTLLMGGSFHLDPYLLVDMFLTFWASPGWAILFLEPIWYRVTAVACLLSLAGLAVLAVRKGRGPFRGQLSSRAKTLLLFSLAIASALAVQVGWHILTGTPHYRQGRSLFPVIVPIAIMLMLGWKQLIPATWHRTALAAFAVTFFLFDTLVLAAYFVPLFYSRY